MFSILSAIETETIIGIVAIIVIVISVAIIVATAIRNYLLHKKMIAENGGDESFIDNDEVQEINGEEVELAVVEESNPAITAEDRENAEQIEEVKEEFAGEELLGEGEVQEINVEVQNESADENQTQLTVDDIKSAKIEEDNVAESTDNIKSE